MVLYWLSIVKQYILNVYECQGQIYYFDHLLCFCIQMKPDLNSLKQKYLWFFFVKLNTKGMGNIIFVSFARSISSFDLTYTGSTSSWK